MNHTLTAVPGLRVGHWTDLDAATGCTVILCPQGAVAGVDVRGGAPGTREIALLDPLCMVERVHAILLSGGSAFGLAAADGVMAWLEEHGHGFDTGFARVPIVPAAILFDLQLGNGKVRPTATAGYAACKAASAGPVVEGSVGAGTGATVGKLLGVKQATKGGLGCAARRIGRGIIVSALAVVNALGDVIDPATRKIVAGARRPLIGGFADSQKFAESRLGQAIHGRTHPRPSGEFRQAEDGSPSDPSPTNPAVTNSSMTNTTLVVVATNVALTKSQTAKVAQMAHDGLARAIRPVHTLLDGDTVFALSLGEQSGDPGLVGAVAADVVGDAIVRAVRMASGLHGVPGVSDLGAPS